MVIVDLMKTSMLWHHLQWVKAHQDDKRPYGDLDIWGHMNCDTDQVVMKFQGRMDNGEVKSIEEGFFTEQMVVCITIDGKKITSHVVHKIWLHIQGQKHHKYLQDKHEWDNPTWNSIDWHGLKAAFLSLSPIRHVKTPKSIHGWLNTGHQKSKISPDAVNLHKCPHCQEPNETHKHFLTCHDVHAHKKCYDLVHPML